MGARYSLKGGRELMSKARKPLTLENRVNSIVDTSSFGAAYLDCNDVGIGHE